MQAEIAERYVDLGGERSSMAMKGRSAAADEKGDNRLFLRRKGTAVRGARRPVAKK
jgi:hypothetical protein